MSLWRRILCRVGLHKRMDIIQSYGSAKHIGCPDCGRTYGMHDGLQVVVPWDATFDELYSFLGYDTKAATERWKQYRRTPSLNEIEHEGDAT